MVWTLKSFIWFFEASIWCPEVCPSNNTWPLSNNVSSLTISLCTTKFTKCTYNDDYLSWYSKWYPSWIWQIYDRFENYRSFMTISNELSLPTSYGWSREVLHTLNLWLTARTTCTSSPHGFSTWESMKDFPYVHWVCSQSHHRNVHVSTHR
jgi:hypothetical protein